MLHEISELNISDSDLYRLKNELRKFLPESITVYGLIDIVERYGPLKYVVPRFYKAKDPKFSSFIFITPISSKNNIKSVTAFWDTNQICDEDVGKLFQNIPNFDWNIPFVFLLSSYRIKLKIDELIKENYIVTELCLEKNTEESSGKGFAFSLADDDYREPKLPEGYELKVLPPSSAATILSTWDYVFSESVEGVIDRLSVLEGVGVFKKDFVNKGNENERLVAWTHQYMSGIIGMTYTVPEERKKGLGAAVTLGLAKRILNEGRTPYLMTESTNVYSQRFHQNIGFKIIGECGFSLYVPQGESLETLLANMS